MRPRSSTWFKEKLMLAEAQEAAFQTEDLDAYDSDCDDIFLSKAVLMANLSSCDLDEGQEMPYSEQTHIVDFPDNEINSDSNIISNSQYLQESQDAGIQDMNSFAPNDLLVLSLVEQMTDHVATLDKENQTNKMTKNAFEIQIKQLSIDNDQLLKQIMSQEIVHIAVNSVDILNVNKSCVDECNKCLELETELLKKKDLIEKDVYDKLLKRVNTTTSASGSKPLSSIKNRISRPPSSNQNNKVEENLRNVKSSLNKMNSVSKLISNAHVKHSGRNAKFESIYAICNKCLFDANHDMCVIDYVNDVNVCRTFTIVRNKCPLTRITSTNEVPLKETTITPVITQSPTLKVVQIVLWYLYSGCSKHMTENRSQLINFAEAVATTCYTQNRSLIRKLYKKTLYELLHDKKPDLSYLHVFGALYYLNNDGEDIGKLKPEADIGIFVGYALAKKAFRINNKRTRMIIETIHVDFDELTTMDSEQFS
ncbi:retrovirus-related pol polyprotein from transposon TNT 1-94 [Tanacetum coccineum]